MDELHYCKLGYCPYSQLYAAQGYDLVCDDCPNWVPVNDTEMENECMDDCTTTITTKADYAEVKITKDSIGIKPNGEVFIQRQDVQTGEVEELTLVTVGGKLYACRVEKQRVFQPGDKVRILDGSKIPDYCSGWTSMMSKYVGRVTFVQNVNQEVFIVPGGYEVTLSGNIFTWDARGLELVTESTED